MRPEPYLLILHSSTPQSLRPRPFRAYLLPAVGLPESCSPVITQYFCAQPLAKYPLLIEDINLHNAAHLPVQPLGLI